MSNGSDTGGGTAQKMPARSRRRRIIRVVVAVVVAAISAYVIYQVSGDIDVKDIRTAVAGTSWTAIGWASLLTVISFIAIALYDVVAAHRVAPGQVSAWLAAFAGAVGHAIASAIGSDVIIGGPVRYRIYAVAGIGVADVARILAVNLATFWMGVAVLFGIALAVDPVGIPLLDRFGPIVDRGVGILLLIAAVAIVVWQWRRDRELSVFGWTLPLPNRIGAFYQALVGAIDIAAAAGVLYVLLPSDVLPSFATFLFLFVAAFIAGTVSHVPAGLGVLEATILISLGAANRPDVIAGLLVFRVIYYLIPAVLAGAGFVLFEAWLAHRGWWTRP